MQGLHRRDSIVLHAYNQRHSFWKISAADAGPITDNTGDWASGASQAPRKGSKGPPGTPEGGAVVGLLAPAVTVATGGVCRGGPSRAYTCCVNPIWKLYLGYTISHESGEQTRAGSCNWGRQLFVCMATKPRCTATEYASMGAAGMSRPCHNAYTWARVGGLGNWKTTWSACRLYR